MTHPMTLPDGWAYLDGVGRTAYQYRYNNRISYSVAKVDHEWLAAFSCDGEIVGYLANEHGLPIPTGFKTALDAMGAVMTYAGEHDPEECFLMCINDMLQVVRSPLYTEAVHGV